MKKFFVVFLLSTLICLPTFAQPYVVPTAYAHAPGTVTFLGPLANAARTYQLLIHEDQLTDLVGQEISAISWRLPASATAPWPTADVTYSAYDVYLSGSVTPSARSLTDFSANVVGPQTQVRSGSLTIPVNAYPSGSSPNDFGPKITLNTPWLYTGGHLLVEIRHQGFTGTSRSVDAIGTAVTGYGTQFSACWTSSYTGNSGSQGNFSVIGFSTLPQGPTLSVLVRAGDVITGYGTVTGIDDITVNNQGDWLVEVRYTPTGGGSTQFLILKNGAVLVGPGDPVPPAPSVVSSTSNIFKALNNHGNAAFRLALTGGPSPNGMYYATTPEVTSTTLLVQFAINGQIASAPQFSPNTPYIGFFRGRLDDSERLLLVASVDDPAIASSVDRALVWFEPNGMGGWTEDVLAKEADVLPGMVSGESVEEFGTNYYSFKIDNHRNGLYVVDIAGAPTTTDGALYYNHELLARKGDPAPLAGASYSDIGSSTRADMSNLGDYIFRANLAGLPAGENVAIMHNRVTGSEADKIFFRLGSPAPGLTETVTSFGTGPSARINDAGEIIWYAGLSGDAAMDQALFGNQALLVRKGVTMAGADLITTIGGTTPTGGITRGFTSSQNGRFILMRCVLNGTTQAAVLMQRPSTPVPLSAVSRKTHGAAGDFDIDLPFTGTPGIECRTGGATNDYTLVVTFGSTVSVAGSPQASVTDGMATIGSGGVSNGGLVTVSGSTVTVPLTNVDNAQTINVTLSGVTSGTISRDLVIPMSVLIGDTNGNGVVNSGDVLQTRTRAGQAADSSNFRSDVNTDGNINAGDALAVRSRSGTSLP